jgi:hypothetical protein
MDPNLSSCPRGFLQVIGWDHHLILVDRTCFLGLDNIENKSRHCDIILTNKK